MDKISYLFREADRLIGLYDGLTWYALDDIVERILENRVITGTVEHRIWKLQQSGYHLDKIRSYINKITKYLDKKIDRIIFTVKGNMTSATSDFAFIKVFPFILFNLNA